MNLNAFIYLFLTLMKYSYSKLSDQCMQSNTFWNSVKYPYIEINKIQTTQSVVFNCPSASSQNCCSSDMKKEMSTVSELKLKEFTEDKLESILKMLSNDSYDLINIFLKDLENTKNDLHQLFSTTYGYNYKMHKEFFFTLFDKLKQYMQGQVHNIGQLVDNFFNEMAEKIVQILIAPGSKVSTIKCHTLLLIEAKPYQETDVLLKKKIIRSYPPARLLVNGIGVGRDVFNELIKNISPSSKCKDQFNTVFHCMLCQGFTIKPCSHTCNTIIDNCFGSFRSSDIKMLDQTFTKYIKTIVQLAGKLDNPFNFPEVNNKINVQISTAIMNIQTMYPNIKEQIKIRCLAGGGGSSLITARKQRQASQEFYKWQTANSNDKILSLEQSATTNSNDYNYNKKVFNTYPSKPNDVLSSFIRKLKPKYKALENYFLNQKLELCSLLSITDASLDCWNGTAVVKNAATEQVKEKKQKNGKVDDPTIKAALGRLNDITKLIHSYLTDVNADPDTILVQNYKLYVSRKVEKPIEGNPQVIFNQKIEGSGESDLSQSNLKPENSKNTPETQLVSPAQPDKTSWELPTLTEGSGKVNREVPDETMKKRSPLSKMPVLLSKNTTVSSMLSPVKLFVTTSTERSTINSNQIPDDEDLNPVSLENKPKINNQVINSSPIAPVIQPEGSGNQQVNPDLSPNKPVTVQSITSTKSLGSLIDGSGEEFKPKQRVDNPDHIFPMLPDSRKPVSTTPRKPNKKPVLNPDDEVALVDGSGKTPQITITPPIEPIDRPQPDSVPQSTSTVTAPVSPDNYPGKVPSEVWLPRLDGVKNQLRDGHRKTTPSGSASDIFSNNLVKRIFLQTMLSLYSINALL